MLKFFLNMTKSEILLYKMIEQSSNFDYSISEISHELNVSRQTVCKSLKTLVTQKLVEKSDFFIGCVRRCKYILNRNLTIQDDANNILNKNLTSQDVANDIFNRNLTIQDDAKYNLNRNLTSQNDAKYNKYDYIYNKNNIYNQSNQIKGISFFGCCQEEILKKCKNFSKKICNKKKWSRDERIYAYWSSKHKLDLLRKWKYFSVCKNVVVNMLKQQDSDLTDFFTKKSSYCVYTLLEGALSKLEQYSDNVVSNVSGYFRKILVNDIANFDFDSDARRIVTGLINDAKHSEEQMNEIIIKNWDLYQKYYPKEAIGIETAKNHEPLTREAFDSRQEQCQDKPWENEQQVYTHVRKKTGKEWLNFFKAETRRLANAFSM